MKTNKGFTLAEVLITLAILGVVASIVIPVTINKVNNFFNYVALKKNYAMLQNVYSLFEVENGQFSQWLSNIENPNEESRIFKFAEKIEPYLNVQKSCLGIGLGDCWGEKPKNLDNKSTYEIFWLNTNSNSKTYVLKGGAILTIQSASANGIKSFLPVPYVTNNNIIFYVDVNGNKGPNLYGRDIFIFVLQSPGSYGANKTKGNEIFPVGHEGTGLSSSPLDWCNPGNNANVNGATCSYRALFLDKGIKY